MNNILAYIDESGDPHFNDRASKNLIYSCILVDSQNVEQVTNNLKEIQKQFSINEFKSSKISNEKRRFEILCELVKLDFKHLHLWVDKENILGDWKNYPKTFYKFTQKLLHRELHRLFNGLSVTVDKFGTEEYQLSFKKYIENAIQLDLFGSNFEIGSAKENVLIQLADFFGGTWKKLMENDFTNPKEIGELLDSKNIYHFKWPDNYQFLFLESIPSEIDRKVAKICVECAETYIKNNLNIIDNRAKVLTVEYLLINVKHIKPYEYIYTDELISWLSDNKFIFSEDEFRAKIIAELRDEDVIIGSSRRGLKIPVKMDEVIEYINSSASMYMKIMKRTKNAVEIFKAKSFGEIDLLRLDIFKIHKKLFENLNE
jgi:hypothetical protein